MEKIIELKEEDKKFTTINLHDKEFKSFYIQDKKLYLPHIEFGKYTTYLYWNEIPLKELVKALKDIENDL